MVIAEVTLLSLRQDGFISAANGRARESLVTVPFPLVRECLPVEEPQSEPIQKHFSLDSDLME